MCCKPPRGVSGSLVGYPNVLAYLLFGRMEGAVQHAHVLCGSARVVSGMEEACAVSVEWVRKKQTVFISTSRENSLLKQH